MSLIADLHLHSTYSDGAFPPEEVVRRIEHSRFDYFSITDHDTISHIPVVEAELDKTQSDLTFIPGVEVSTDFEGFDVHLLLYFNSKNLPELEELLAGAFEERRRIFRLIAEKMQDFNFHFDVEKLLETLNSPGRMHLAQELVKSDFVKNMDAAFAEYLEHGAKAFIPKNRPKLRTVLNRSKEIGALSSIAHIGVYPELLQSEAFKSLPFDGVEVFHPDHDMHMRDTLLDFAYENNHVVTGGSDHHGWDTSRGDIGDVGLNAEYMNEFLELFHKIK